MKAWFAALAGMGLVLAGPVQQRLFVPPHANAGPPTVERVHLSTAPLPAPPRVAAHATLAPEQLTKVVQHYCMVCHNDQLLTGNMTLSKFRVEDAPAQGEIAEMMIMKLRAGMMPPPGAPRPGPDTLADLVQTLERTMDDAAAKHPNPGRRTFQRMNRAEYTAAVKQLLDLDIDAADYLPLDTKSANFDNIADVQLLSPTLMDAYLHAAQEVSRLAIGYPEATATETQYRVSRWASQTEHVPGAPYGTRGGVSSVHNFPADGSYRVRVGFSHETTGALVGNERSALNSGADPEQLEISVDGSRVALLDVDPWMHASDPNGTEMRTDPFFVSAGPHRVSAAFIRHVNGPVQDLISPHDWSLASTAMADAYGFLQLPHLVDMVVAGPYKTTGVSETPSRDHVFTCRPLSEAAAPACAEQILSRLATEAFRRPLQKGEIEPIMRFYADGSKDGGFEHGIRTALEAILASPNFIFRFEPAPAGTKPGHAYALNGFELASRLSFFLWGTPPDAELDSLGRSGKLADLKVLDAQTHRMLADKRADALGERFAAQWLRLQDLDKINPDVRLYPDFHQQLRDAMHEETVDFFNHLVREDRPVMELFTADYSFMNEALAKHYGISGVVGDQFRMVKYPDTRRRGIFGHASILTLTSVAGRTSPVLRGKWVMEVILGTPPPPPPPGVPALEETAGTKAGHVLTTRERMEIHRKAPVCNSCHRFMDPIGLALDNYDVTGKWRIRENGAPLDTRGQLYDGTPLATPVDLETALLKRPVPIVRNFTKNLLAYALGRRVEWYDAPAVRQIVAQADQNGDRMSSFILGVVNTDAFRMKAAPAAPQTTTTSSN